MVFLFRDFFFETQNAKEGKKGGATPNKNTNNTFPF
jgi:hypothetical protein